MKNIIFLAPPAAGKGTISDYLVKNYHYEHLSTGDLLRSEVASGSALGREINDLISVGKLVSDELIIQLVSSKLEGELKNKPFILDGFPRTLNQAQKLDEMLNNLHIDDVVVVYLDVSLDILLKRVLGRVVCPDCKRSYNLDNPLLKPQVDNICDRCGAILERRADDNEEIFKERYQTFLLSTKQIMQYYDDKKLLVKVDGTKELNLIYDEMESIIGISTLTGKRGEK